MPYCDLLKIYQWVERTAVRGGWRPLLYVAFCIYLVREILFLSGKSQGILKTDVCGNHVIEKCHWLHTRDSLSATLTGQQIQYIQNCL